MLSHFFKWELDALGMHVTAFFAYFCESFAGGICTIFLDFTIGAGVTRFWGFISSCFRIFYYSL